MKKLWVEWEERYLRDHWLEIGDKGLAKRLGRSLYSVQTKRYSLGICVNPADWSADEDAYILEQLAGVLYRRTLELKKVDYDCYFQRAMCMNWDVLHSRCAAGCEDCDACTEFIRIQPQYCVRCGATFFERSENRVCAPCRAARKRQGFKKYRYLNNRKGA